MNFQKTIQELLDAGFTQVDIAKKCNCSQSSISDIYSGKTENPNFALGSALMQLHASNVKQEKRVA